MSTFTTQATGYIDAQCTGVDPRTGQFNLNLPLADISANAHNGASLSLSLSYSGLSTDDLFGLGTGVTLGGISLFDTSTRRLSMSNGESWSVDNNNKLSARHLKDCQFSGSSNHYILRWKNGTTETLIKCGAKYYITGSLTTPTGKTLSLDWAWNGSSIILTRIYDSVNTLMKVQQSFGQTRITVWPDSLEEYRVTLVCQNGRLATIGRQVNNMGEELTWQLAYSLVGQNEYRLTQVISPTGMKDVVTYSNSGNGLYFPSHAGQGVLPAVQRHVRHPGGGQPVVESTWTYTSNNFLGNNTSVGDFGYWSSERDYIYGMLVASYQYGSTVRTGTADDLVVITCTYNNYHQLLSKETSRKGCLTRETTVYGGKAGVHVSSQPATYLLPSVRTTSWTDSNGARREEITRTEFDDYGNPTRTIAPDGTETLTEYYPASGEGNDCPSEPHGFIRFVKKTTILPRQSSYNDVQPKITQYTYMKLGNTNSVVQRYTQEYAGSTLLARRETAYSTVSGVEFGRIIKLTDTRFIPETTAQFTSRQDITTHVSGYRMTQVTRFTGHDGLTTTTTRIQSALSSLKYSETDVMGVTVGTTWDLMGRPLTETRAPGTPYEKTRSWQYTLDSQGPVTITTDESGNQVRTYFDGLGREVGSDRREAGGSWKQFTSTDYDVQGQVARGKAYDSTASDSFTVEQSIVYDGWGNASLHTFSTGLQHNNEFSPITLMREENVNGSKGLRSGKNTTHYDNISKLPVSTVRRTSTGIVQSELKTQYDGMNRIRRQVDELGNTTTFTFDLRGREHTRTLPDGTIITRTWAPHIDNMCTSITVIAPEGSRYTVGERTFDSLGRVTWLNIGGRITTFRYEGACPYPSIVVLPSGREQHFKYIKELGNATESISAAGVHQSFTYNPVTEALIHAREGGSQTELEWSVAGQIIGEKTTRNGVIREARSSYTLGGHPLTYTDISGASTYYRYDSTGRLTEISDNALKIVMTYDALNRPDTRSTIAHISGHAQTTTWVYDDFSREISRQIVEDGKEVVTVRQTWYDNNLLKTRSTSKGSTVLKKETYEYDSRNRLTEYRVTGSQYPVDGYGMAFTAQSFSYDALNNITRLITTLTDGTSDTAVFHFGNTKDATQLTRVTHSHAAYPKQITLSYDANGQMSRDEAGRTLDYDGLGRQSSVWYVGNYGYDAFNRLVEQNRDDGESRLLYYRGAERVNEVRVGEEGSLRLLRQNSETLGVVDNDVITQIVGDQNNSLLWHHTSGEANGKLHHWSPYGNGNPDKTLPGYNGERVDLVSGSYHLGNGYRAYNPVLMRFNSPDSLSPFGEGGINPYAYCAGDPVNHTDPTGHLSWQSILGIVTGVIGIALAVVTAGASIAAAGGVMAALSATSTTTLVLGGISVASDVIGIVSGALEEVDPETSAVLGWVSMGAGLAGLGTGVAAAGLKSAFRSSKPVSISVLRGVTAARQLASNNQVEQLSTLAARRMTVGQLSAMDSASPVLPSKLKFSTSRKLQSAFIEDAIRTTGTDPVRAVYFMYENADNLDLSRDLLRNFYRQYEGSSSYTTLGRMNRGLNSYDSKEAFQSQLFSMNGNGDIIAGHTTRINGFDYINNNSYAESLTGYPVARRLFIELRGEFTC